MTSYGRSTYRRGPVVNREPTARNRAVRGHQPASRKQKYPRERRGRARKWFRRILVFTSVSLTLGMVIGGFGFWFLWSSLGLPADKVPSQTSFILDDSGKHELLTINSGENRIAVALRDVPKVVRDAVIATEDQNFYTHHGVDPIGVTRALVNDLRGGALQGGSTITQQYVKQVHVGTDRTASRKVREAILAMKLEQRLSKDQILERYLNTIYFGRGAYGIQTASRAYFDKDVQNIDLQEAAYLAGLIRGPEYADVYKSPDEARQRRNLTLDSMVRSALITPEQAEATKAIDIKSYTKARSTKNTQAGSAAPGTEYFTEWVHSILVQRYGEKRVETGGLTVKTTLNVDNQRAGYQAIYNNLKPNEPAGALVSIDDDGYVKAMVGGRSYEESKVNLALGTAGGGSGRQAGSTFKTFELASVLDRGACLYDQYEGPGKLILPGWDSDPKKPQLVSNYNDENYGYVTLEQATSHSINTVYAQLVMKDGTKNLIDAAKRAGITSNLQPVNSLVLGSVEVSPLEMANAYMTFGSRGLRATPNPILEVKNSNGETLETARPQKTRAFDQSVADSVNQALSAVVLSGTGRGAQIGRPVAGKTGTTEDYGDAWFVGYTPKLSTAIWMGYPEGNARKMTNVRGMKISGGTLPAQMFASYMRSAVPSSSPAFESPPRCTPTVGPRLETETETETTEDPWRTRTPTTVDPFNPSNNRGRGRSTTSTTPSVRSSPSDVVEWR